ncbi:MAG TPA: hypothetical protein VF189_02260 [Patescibacteria group bacterium]
MKIRIYKSKIKKILSLALPLWMVIVISFQSSAAIGIAEYYILHKEFNKSLSELAEKTKSPDELLQILKQEVLPKDGYTLGVTWGDIGQRLLETGVIDKEKYKELFSQDPGDTKMMNYLTHGSKDHMKISEANSNFMVNTLWALGLVNKNEILEKGAMKTYGQGDPMQYASTGGWNLGTKNTDKLYSSAQIITLTSEQQALVEKIASTIYRPCCGNPVSFPDCNHGMAVLGYIELAVKEGISENKIYKDVLALNSFWFPQQYVTLAAYFKQQKTDWNKIDSKLALGNNYSSSQGTNDIMQKVRDIPGLTSKGGSC